jgi:hypothetical protein
MQLEGTSGRDDQGRLVDLVVAYSDRRVIVGSIPAARRAGIALARNAVSQSRSGIPTKISGSHALTAKSKFATSLVAARERPNPITIPPPATDRP